MYAKEDSVTYVHEERSTVEMCSRILNLASTALAETEFKQDSLRFWEEPYQEASKWKPRADKRYPTSLGKPEESNGYIMVSTNGGFIKAPCNAVAVASLLNATLVLPKFLYSNVWKDSSQFGDIYQEDYFMSMLKDGIHIVQELPPYLKSLDVGAIGSLDETFYISTVTDIIFAPLQRLRCKCNIHAIKFVLKIQVGSLLIRRIRKFKYDATERQLDKQLLGDFAPGVSSKEDYVARGSSKYLALHLRFEEDMVAYSLCDFGGGEYKKKELETYREPSVIIVLPDVVSMHMPDRSIPSTIDACRPVSPAELRKLGRCPLTPEEAALVLAALGFKRGTYIYLAGSRIYSGSSRMRSFYQYFRIQTIFLRTFFGYIFIYLEMLRMQLAALGFIGCATSDVFAMTDSGSQLSSLVSGFLTYCCDGHAPTLRPNKKRLAAIFSENSSIGWNTFEDMIRKMIDEGQRVRVRGSECMCRS
ncbi:O-fucosyltransferase family protein isoform 2 [Hibiscus syriacus]|uniref:O-fucosyltransferase family protein n=1 Tax=Hibiscus syriacus TaxID=106335 RepID=A0A6A2YF41_HIBSY|nr:O-fucosyltransferase family protein isoform 2 [Hibiscus syriacus]